eukprot:GHVT01042897.1.p1 GENE.GHVT01042897.1~~GHVT01042897.1.p1  ORF type:complete len:252 (-),score=34.35 GHVT01042897.1:1423-2178(-)
MLPISMRMSVVCARSFVRSFRPVSVPAEMPLASSPFAEGLVGAPGPSFEHQGLQPEAFADGRPAEILDWPVVSRDFNGSTPVGAFPAPPPPHAFANANSSVGRSGAHLSQVPAAAQRADTSPAATDVPRGVRTHAPSKQTGRQPAAEGPVAKAIAGLKQRRENYARKGFPETRLLRTPREQRTQTQPETGEPSDSNLETALETNRHLCFQDGKRRLHCGRNQVPKTFIGWSDFSFAVAAYFHPNTDPPEQC